MSETRRDLTGLALAAGEQATAALVELLRFAREGAGYRSTFDRDAEPVEQLLDAAKLAIEIRMANEGDDLHDDEINQVYGAICKFLEGWA